MTLPAPALRLADFLGELGGRWGNPALPCRVHGYLYLVARPATEAELREALALGGATLADALAWLEAFGLAERAGAAQWRTESDPWNVLMRALEERRRRELAPALDLLRGCRSELAAAGPEHQPVGAQVDKLVALAEDLAAIDAQASRLSPERLRSVLRVGGRAARFVDRHFGKERPR
ncbi:MAG: hypothetical protein QNJ67_09465 [Kiloniellales bacterium]|nr:hypothetical protein [Kiloniellales bacterium]